MSEKYTNYRKDPRTGFQKFATKVIKAGQIPKHIAFIMDGNRSYSKRNGISIAEGYQRGADRFGDSLKWCAEFGVKEVTAYAFSIENFKRPEEEKEHIFKRIKKYLVEIIESCDGGECDESIRIIGDWNYFPEDIRKIMAEAMLRTRHYTGIIINLAFVYTSRNEIVRGAEIVRRGVLAGDIEVDDISQDLLTDVLQVFPTNPVDILIRTSDTHRLSDFLMWQTSESVLWFLKHDWPELTFWDVWKSIFEFQKLRHNSQDPNLASGTLVNTSETFDSRDERRVKFLEKVSRVTWEKLETISKS